MIRWVTFWWIVVGMAVILLAVPAAAHDPYYGIKSDDGIDCCGADDCEPLPHGNLRVSDGSFEVLIDGQWAPVPDNAIARDKSPDGQVHWCPQKEYFNMTAHVIGTRCLILPMVM